MGDEHTPRFTQREEPTFAEDIEQSLEDFRSKGQAALRRAAAADAEADEAQLQATLYTKAAKDLKLKAFHLRSEAIRLEAKGQDKAAKENHKSHRHLLKLIDKQYELADRKGKAAAEFQRIAYRQRSIAEGLAHHVRQMNNPGKASS